MRTLACTALIVGGLLGCGNDASDNSGTTVPTNVAANSNVNGDPSNNRPDNNSPDNGLPSNNMPGNNTPNAGTNADTNGVTIVPTAPQRWARETRLTHDVDRDLAAVLETQNLEGACERWEAGDRDDETKYRCGKWMFFYETFGTVGVPADILKFSQKWFADTYYGDGFSNFGFVPDPADSDGMPIGLAPTTGEFEGLKTRAFTCAACHFGQMPDGRYAVGYGNMSLDYGRFIGGLGAPLSLSLNENDENVHPQIRAELAGPVQQAKQDQTYMIELGILGLSLLSAGPNSLMDAEAQARFLALRPGTMDFLTPPLVDDEQWTVSRILSLWNIPNEDQRAAAGMNHEQLSWTGGATSLDNFISGFVAIGVADADAWGPERIEPLKAYVSTLQVPDLEATIDASIASEGARLFVDEGCADCHIGPSGESNRAYSFEEVGTDPAMEFIFNPDANDDLCCGFDEQPGPDSTYDVTRGVKAPRLAGIENQTKFLHNGSVDGLRQLLCLDERPQDDNYAQGSQGHEYGCDLTQADRTALIVYMNSL